MKLPVGVKRLDDLLKGGVPPASFTLVYGPPFLGKDVLSRQFVLEGLKRGEPALLVLTNDSAQTVRRALEAMDPAYRDYESRGLVSYVDAYTRAIGGPEEGAHVEYVDGPMNLNGLSTAIANAQKRLATAHPSHRMVFNSLSTLIAFTNAQTVFRFLQVFIGRSRMAGAAGFLLLDSAMHTDAEVQTLKHLCDGVLEMRADSTKTVLHVAGIGVTEATGWTEYRFDETEFEVVGSFAAGRIR